MYLRGGNCDGRERARGEMDSHLLCGNKASKYPRNSSFDGQKTLGVQPTRIVYAAIENVSVLDERVRVVLVPEGQSDELPWIHIGALLNLARGHKA
jgi:hypothetical protein